MNKWRQEIDKKHVGKQNLTSYIFIRIQFDLSFVMAIVNYCFNSMEGIQIIFTIL